MVPLTQVPVPLLVLSMPDRTRRGNLKGGTCTGSGLSGEMNINANGFGLNIGGSDFAIGIVSTSSESSSGGSNPMSNFYQLIMQ